MVKGSALNLRYWMQKNYLPSDKGTHLRRRARLIVLRQD